MIIAVAGALGAGFGWLESLQTKSGAKTEIAVASQFQLEMAQRIARLEAFHERDAVEGPPMATEPEPEPVDEGDFVDEDFVEPAPVQRIGTPIRKPSPKSEAVQKRIREYKW